MRQTLLLIAVVTMAGCGKRTSSEEPEANAEPQAAGKKQIPPEAFTNTLSMKFVPIPRTGVAFSIYETRVKDYAVYAALKEDNQRLSWKKPGFKQADTHPVVNVSWNDARAFCAWLTKKELAEGKIKAGQKYRLPTDAEWSVAVGLGKENGNTPNEKDGGVKGVYSWGKEWPPPAETANYSKSLKVDKFDHTASVGSFPANQFGLHDMGGNVMEFCEDKYSQFAYSGWVLRGASWYISDRKSLLSSSRYKCYKPDERNPNYGFRCVLANE